MRVIAWKGLREFAAMHSHALGPLKVWAKSMKTQTFANPAEVKRAFGPSVDFLPDAIVVFDIGGNKYRISANIRYHAGLVFIRHVMTHDEYNRRTRNCTL